MHRVLFLFAHPLTRQAAASGLEVQPAARRRARAVALGHSRGCATETYPNQSKVCLEARCHFRLRLPVWAA